MATAATSLLLLVFVAVSGAPAARAAVPVIHGFDPMEGPFGAPVTIYGEGFEGATAVLFDGVPAGFTVEDDELIATTVPEGSTAGPIIVVTPDGTDSVEEFLVIEPPVVAAFSPHQGPVGTVVRIDGDHLGYVRRVWFGQHRAIFERVSYTRLKAVVPEGLRHARVRVRSAGGTAWSERKFHVQRGRG